MYTLYKRKNKVINVSNSKNEVWYVFYFLHKSKYA